MVKANRIIGLDILRIFSMFGIIGLHIIYQGGLIVNADIHSIKYYSILFFLVLFYTSVDTFGILSGYLNSEKDRNKHSRIIELITIVIFYCFLITSIYYIFHPEKITTLGFKELILNFIPIIEGKYWYITSYVFLFFLIPFINKFCKSLKEKSFKKLLIIIFVLLSIIPTLFLGQDIFRVQFGYSPFWLVYCYMIGAYIRMYGISFDNKKTLKYFFLVFFSSFVLNALFRNLGFFVFGRVVKESYLIDYVSPFTITLSISLLILFKRISIKDNNIIEVIKYLSSATFSVYIIHSHRIIFNYYFANAFAPLLNYNSIVVSLRIIASIILIYAVCCVIDALRKLFFKIFKINNLILYLGAKLDKLLN